VGQLLFTNKTKLKLEYGQLTGQSCYSDSQVVLVFSNSTSVCVWYPAKGRPGSRSTKLDSGAQKRLIRSPIKGYGPRPMPLARARCRTTGQRACERANSDRRPLRRPACVASGDFLEVGNFVRFSEFLANVNSRSCSLYAIAVPSVCRLTVTLVYSTQPVEIFGNFSSPFGTLAIH